MSVCVDLQALAAAVKAVLVGVSGIGKVDDRPGGVPTWQERPRPEQNFWWVDIVSAEERSAGIGTQAFDGPMIRVEGFMPWSYSNPNSADTWRPLVSLVRDRIRKYPTLATEISGFSGIDLPQLRTNDRVGVSDGTKEVLCHHAVIEVRTQHHFSYTVSTTL